MSDAIERKPSAPCSACDGQAAVVEDGQQWVRVALFTGGLRADGAIGIAEEVATEQKCAVCGRVVGMERGR